MSSVPVKIDIQSRGTVIGEKRQRLPYVLTWTCPRCKVQVEQDYSSRGWYLSEPQIPGVHKISFYCEDCDITEVVDLEVRITVRCV